MYDLKIFAKSDREVYGLVSTVQLLSNDIGNKKMWCTCTEKKKIRVI